MGFSRYTFNNVSMNAEGITDAGQLLQLLSDGIVIATLRCGSDDYVDVTGFSDPAYILLPDVYSGPYRATGKATVNGGSGE